MFERCIYFNTNALTRKLNARWEQAFSRYDLTPSHGYLLRVVLEKPGLSQQAISTELRLEKSTVTRFLTQLEARGFVVRKTSQNDPRQNEIFPTAKTLTLKKDLDALGDTLYEQMCTALGENNVKNFVTLARSINSQI